MSIGQPTSRRSVLQFVVLGACFTGFDVRALRAQALLDGKPLLTQDNMNKMLAQNSTGKERSELVAAIAKDPASFVKQHFAVTSQQIKEIDSIPKDQMARIVKAVQDTERHGRWVIVEVSKDGCRVVDQWQWDEAWEVKTQLEPDRVTIRIYHNNCPDPPATG